ncbi:zinc knuckle-domain-containing protein [Fusarium oxysporum]|nr:zinc knuckle-domain-containing protein [Fusarium oxysporum]
MFTYRGRGGPSRSTPSSVQCQKCLKRGHYSYECKATAQERPYVSRPSRSQQFRNPKLVPKLTNETLNPLEKKKGVADEELAKLEAERAREREREQRDDGLIEPNIKRHRSVSSHSVSTISTTAPRSPSPGKDRARSPAQSPRSRSPYLDNSQRGRQDDSRSRSRSRSRSPSLNRSRSPRVEARYRRSDSGSSPSPEDSDRRDQYRSRDPLPSVKGSAPATHPREYPSKSRSPHSLRRQRSGSPRSPQPRGRRDERPDRSSTRHDRERLPPRGRFDDRRHGHGGPGPGDQARERSLSPFSQRLAMTQAMKGGRQ